MSLGIQIVEAKRHHCGPMARRMRREHGAEIARLGNDVHRVLVRTFERSPFRRSAFWDGQIVAMGGVMGADLSPHGCVWLALGDDFAKDHPIVATREATRWMGRLMTMKSALTAICLIGDAPSRRLLEFLGFAAEAGPDQSEIAAMVYRRATQWR